MLHDGARGKRNRSINHAWRWSGEFNLPNDEYDHDDEFEKDDDEFEKDDDEFDKDDGCRLCRCGCEWEKVSHRVVWIGSHGTKPGAECGGERV